MDITASEGVCMSTTLDGAGKGQLSMCVLLSVQCSRHQQGAPFQFTHQQRRQGVKVRSITVRDFTFDGRDYQSGDPCVEVMRAGDGRGTVWGELGLELGEGGVVKGGGRGGSATQRHPGIRGLSVFQGALLPSCTSV